MAKHLILRNASGSPDGRTVVHYKKGDVVELTDHLAPIFVKDGVAELVDGEKAQEAPKNKAAKAPKNKGEEGTEEQPAEE
jgi:hypothetical protein